MQKRKSEGTNNLIMEANLIKKLSLSRSEVLVYSQVNLHGPYL